MKKIIKLAILVIIIVMFTSFNYAKATDEQENTTKQENTTNIEEQNIIEDSNQEKPNDEIKEETKKEDDKETKEEPSKPEKKIMHIEEGIYQIESVSKKVLEVTANKQENHANIQIGNNKKTQNQKFRITRINGTDYYKITAIHSAKSMKLNKTNVEQLSYKGSDGQAWLLVDAGNGYFNIISKVNNLYLDISKENVQVSSMADTVSQKFKLNKINIIENNTYEIQTKSNSNKVMEIAKGSKKNGAKAQIWDASNSNKQRFKLVALSTDTYKIIAKHSKKALTVNKKTGKVYQENYSGKVSQQWKIIESGKEHYYIQSKKTGKMLEIDGGKCKNGKNIKVNNKKNKNYQKFTFVTGFRTFYEEGTYGKSGLKIKGDKRGTYLKYYKIGKGSKKFFATFSIHGFEDSYDHDGSELTYLAEEFNKYLKKNITEDIVNKYTIYIFPNLNPDGQKYGKTNNGPGRTTLYSSAPKHQGIDMNRNWSVRFVKQTAKRNYNGTAPFQAYEAKYLRDFILKNEGKSNILIDTHGWLNETMGDNTLGKFYRKTIGMTKHIKTYGRGYLINWATTLKNGRSALIELPEVSSHKKFIKKKYTEKWIKATMNLLKKM